MAVDVDAVEKALMRGRTAAANVDEAWVLDDGRAGHVNQALGIAEALGVKDPELRRVRLRKLPWGLRWLWGFLPVETVFDTLPKDVPPTVVLGAGSRNSRVLRWLKCKYGKKVFTVQVLKPRGPWDAFDVVVMPQHDRPPAGRKNICVTTGALGRVTAARLAAEADRWERRLQHCKLPRLAVMVGGASRHGRFGVEEARALVEDVLQAAKANGYSVMVSTSRRTGTKVTKVLRKAFEGQKDVPVAFWQPDDPEARDNPYFAYLALAQGVVVTGESVSMISEAATAGKPVYVWGASRRMPRKFGRFLELMVKQGRAKLWDGRLGMRAPAAGLMDTLLVAGFVKARLRQRG
ncbi:MAG: mitochondrial fission ELM1 family protein [Pseudomonadaceae bacterium]|nr:mitochondrial fission ELM1 family protein [Pseudomonadaceae bacterium]